MSTKKLIGKDGKIFKCTKGTEITATTPLAEGFYVATAIAAASGLPDGLEVGYPFYASGKTGQVITPVTGDKTIKLTLTEMADIKSAGLEFKKEEVDVTTLSDDLKTYRAGFSDAQGSLDGITTIGVSETLIGKFIPTVVQGADLQDVVISEVNGDSLYMMLEINATSTDTEPVAMYFAPVSLLSYKASIAVDGEQSFSSDFRIAPDDTVKAVFLEVEQV